jgi:type II secretory pathway pseudopilin PulG
MSMKLVSNERGFTLAELMVASTVTMLVLGGAVALTSQVQNSYRRQIEDAAAEQEGRYALEWVSRLIRGAGNNPFQLPPAPDPPPPAVPTNQTGNCPVAGTEYRWVIMDPNSDLVNDDIRLQTDSNPPDGVLGGTGAGLCTQGGEDVTVSYNSATRSITFLDNNLGGTASIRTDAVIDGLTFIYREADRDIATTNATVFYVETQIRVRTRTLDPSGMPQIRTLSQEVRVRGRNY